MFTIYLLGGIPGEIPLSLMTVMLSIPLYIIIAYSILGFSYLKRMPQGKYLHGWVLALLFSLFLSLITKRFYIDRQAEYLIVPLCIAASVAIYYYLKEKTHHHKKIIALIIIANALVVYPIPQSFEIADESITEADITVLKWMQGNVSNNSVITSDHRLSVLAWSYGFNISFDTSKHLEQYSNQNISIIWNSSNLSQTLYQLDLLNTTHLIIDDIMFESKVNSEINGYHTMSNESYNKFKKPPFTLLYRNETKNNENETIHWAEVYKLH